MGDIFPAGGKSVKKISNLHVLHLLIDYFESGNTETDAAAKAVIESDMDGREIWSEVIRQYRQGAEWTGLRAPEAEILANALREISPQVE